MPHGGLGFNEKTRMIGIPCGLDLANRCILIMDVTSNSIQTHVEGLKT
jgi:hypothetical protein